MQGAFREAWGVIIIMKHMLSLILAVAIAASLTGCTGNLTLAPENRLQIQQAAEVPAAPQVDVTFPVAADDLSKTLANNSLQSFKGYAGQGVLYLTPHNIQSADVFVNGTALHISDLLAQKDGKTVSVDISQLTRNDHNTVQITNLQPEGASLQLRIPYPTVIQGTPEQVGLSSKKLNQIDALINNEVANGFPGGQLVVIKDGRMVKNSAYGVLNAYEPDGTPKKDSAPVTTSTMYDLASVTKMFATNYAIQTLVSNKTISITDKISQYLPNFQDPPNASITGKGEMTIQNVLEHQAGFQPTIEYYDNAYDQFEGAQPGVNTLFSQNKDTTVDMICQTPLSYPPGAQTAYSDIDYMILGIVVERATGMPLDQYVENTIYKPLGLDRMVYRPLEKGYAPEDCAATELNGNTRDGTVHFPNVRTNTLQGEVHDEKAYYCMGGVSGHAGLFGCAEQLGTLAQVMLNGGGYGDVALFDADTVDNFIKPKFSSPTYGLGWRRMGSQGYGYYFGEQANRSAFGHTGWTGTMVSIDPDEDLIVVWLTNKINSPLVDPQQDSNNFSGSHYLCASLGIVPTLVYDAMDNTDNLVGLYSQMLRDKITQIDSDPYAQTDADNQSMLAIAQTLKDIAQTSSSKADKQTAIDALQAMPDVSDKPNIN